MWHFGSLLLTCLTAGCALSAAHLTLDSRELKTAADRIIAGAKAQLSWGTKYDPAYYVIPYPNGDLPKDKGVCTDVVVRALRHGGYDLQQLIHEDMRRNFDKYPQIWGNKGPDRNIDHRRTPNQMTFFQRHGLSLTTIVSSENLGEWQPGDFVFWKLPNGMNHVGVLSDKRNHKGMPLIIHNLSTTREEDVLEAWKVTGHYRFPKEQR